jgi:hypothetical protein
VRLQLSVLTYNLGNLWRRLVLPTRIDGSSLTSVSAVRCWFHVEGTKFRRVQLRTMRTFVQGHVPV